MVSKQEELMEIAKEIFTACAKGEAGFIAKEELYEAAV